MPSDYRLQLKPLWFTGEEWANGTAQRVSRDEYNYARFQLKGKHYKAGRIERNDEMREMRERMEASFEKPQKMPQVSKSVPILICKEIQRGERGG